MIMDTINGILGVDLETASAVSLPRCGAEAYAEHPSTLVHCIVFGYLEPATMQEPTLHVSGTTLPESIVDYVRAGGRLLAHNVSFERAVWKHILVPRFGFPIVKTHQWVDTQALGCAQGLPRSLAGLANVLGTDHQKDEEGAQLMRRMMVTVQDEDGRWHVPLARDPENMRRLECYCTIDVLVMLQCYLRLPPLSVTEQRVWQVDQRINQRGACVDLRLAERLRQIVAKRREQLNLKLQAVTQGELLTTTSIPAIKSWLTSVGVKLPKVRRKRTDGRMVSSESINSRSITMLLESEKVPDCARSVLQIRQEAGKATSLAKLDRVPDMLNRDGRLRNALQYCGASTGRWSSHGIQIHNLPKNKLEPNEFSLVRYVLRHGTLDDLRWVTDDPLSAISQCIRSLFIASPGCAIVGGDFSAVEARVIAWLAGHDSILELYRSGKDVYQYTASLLGSRDRQLGKVCVLALGFGMGAYKFWQTAAETWGVELEPKRAYQLQRAWRRMNEPIVYFWHALEDEVKLLLRGQTVGRVGAITFGADEFRFWLRLPSGRRLSYWRPSLHRTTRTIRTIDEHGAIVDKEIESTEIRYFESAGSSQMTQTHTYGGKLAENVTQAVARDLLAESLLRLDRKGYEIIAHTHDSIAAEVPAKSAVELQADFGAAMAYAPPWAERLPLAVDTYCADHIRG